ncbi:MAG: outer membrane protein transport protein [Saprospirales bacterium]|nr:outer membrane protein transport protein [Saprospirales bacterium]
MCKRSIFTAILFLSAVFMQAQTGHILQGNSAANFSMGGVATGQALDIAGVLNWNPAGIAAFDRSKLSVSAGLFFSTPEVASSVPTPVGTFSGNTTDEKGNSIIPTAAFVFGKEGSKHHAGIHAFGVSGFGVEYPMSETNPITLPQSDGGFGHVFSNYQLMQVGATYAYELSDQFSIGVAPLFNYSALEVRPNPLASPSLTLGYPESDNASALGFGFQAGLYFQSESGFKAGASYKSTQFFGDLSMKNTYLDGSDAGTVNFNLDFPAIYSLGLGYSNDLFDLGVDYRYIDYANTDGFSTTGWTQMAAVAGFGWQSISVVTAGVQFKGISNLPIRAGYTYSQNPVQSETAFFSTSAPAVIEHAFQFGLGYAVSERFAINAGYHYGLAGEVSGQLLSPLLITAVNPYGAVPGSNVTHKMTTSMVLLGVDIAFGK